MEGIRQWAFSACVAMVACGISRMILPGSNLRKVFGVTASAFFLCCLLLPVMTGIPEIGIRIEESVMPDIKRRAEALEEAAGSQARELAEDEVKKIISEKLGEMGIKYVDIAINITTNGQNGPEVERADITLDAAHEPDHERNRAVLSEVMGFEIRLGYRETEPGQEE